MKRFEYKVENLRTHGMTTMVLTKDHEKRFNELGKEGWELVGLEKSSRNILAIFKREKID
ncbi:MAG: DUF4177 domain-containing protein [Firmicutes bacterium]|nr:DUF4177 domain-containing protein [Bacillota bacterium]